MVLPIEIADWLQPMLCEPILRTVQDCLNSSTAIVSANDDVLDLQRLDGELQDRHTVEIRWIDQVCNVPVNKDLARLQAGDDVGRHPAIGTANPKELGRL
jgi:hypothetical protein